MNFKTKGAAYNRIPVVIGYDFGGTGFQPVLAQV
jgi:hypothetical protein